MSHVSASCHMWVSHVTCGWVLSHMSASCHIWVSHVTYECVMPHMGESFHIRMRHVTHMGQSCHMRMSHRPTQSIMYVALQVIRFHKSILLIVQCKYLKSCCEDFILKSLILRTRSCGTAFITQHSWLLHFRQAEICLVEMICTTGVPASKGHLGGASPWTFLHDS